MVDSSKLKKYVHNSSNLVDDLLASFDLKRVSPLQTISQDSNGGLRSGPVVLSWLEAVSYTHLDVYKRQGV